VLTLVNGTPKQRAMVQDALTRWWGPLMQMHGFRTPPEKDKDLIWKIKAKPNEELRQEFLNIYVPRIREIGLELPDPNLSYDDATQRWEYTEPDWDELKRVVTGHGPKSQERLAFRRLHYAETAWVRDVVLGEGAVTLAAD
jgi:ring-1,2-phenylacetyl-CoA epoxidase subunit PaaA